jgi:hypothetical protein
LFKQVLKLLWNQHFPEPHFFHFFRTEAHTIPVQP